MTRRVKTVRADDRVYDAVQMLVAHGISGAPVVDAKGHLIGMLSEKDCIQALMRAVVHRLPSSKVSDVMDRNLTSVREDAHFLTITHLFLYEGLRRIPVVDDDGRLIGQISRRDLLAKAMQIFEKAPTREAAILYLSAFEGTIPPTS